MRDDDLKVGSCKLDCLVGEWSIIKIETNSRLSKSNLSHLLERVTKVTDMGVRVCKQTPINKNNFVLKRIHAPYFQHYKLKIYVWNHIVKKIF